MKKTFILVVLIFIAASSSFAQVEFGMKAGLNFSSSSMNVVNSAGTIVNDVAIGGTSFHFGFYSILDFELFSIQPEVYYSIQSTTFELNTQEPTLHTVYVQIPLLGRLDFLNVLNVHAGPQFGILVSNKIAYIGGGEEDIKEQTKNLDIGFVVGVGAYIPIPDNEIEVTFRYVLGFSEMISESVPNGPSSLKNSMFQLSASYAFGAK